jgi:hypothetical protein
MTEKTINRVQTNRFKTCIALIWYDIMDFLVALFFILAAAAIISGSLNLANGFSPALRVETKKEGSSHGFEETQF